MQLKEHVNNLYTSRICLQSDLPIVKQQKAKYNMYNYK